jgi:hypothetical protein
VIGEAAALRGVRVSAPRGPVVEDHRRAHLRSKTDPGAPLATPVTGRSVPRRRVQIHGPMPGTRVRYATETACSAGRPASRDGVLGVRRALTSNTLKVILRP